MTTETNKPVEKIKIGGVQIAIWKNMQGVAAFYSATVELSYRDADGGWSNNAKNFGYRDLLNLAKAALLAHSAMGKLRASHDKPAHDADDASAE